MYGPPPIYGPPMPLPSIEQVFGFVMSLPGVQKQLYRLTVPPSHSQPQPYAPPPPMPAAPAPQQDASIPPRDGELSQQEWKQKLLNEGRAYCNRYPGDPVCGREKLGRSQ